MKIYQLKNPETIQVLGTTETGDYIVFDATQGDKLTVEIHAKADFEAKYMEVVQAPAADPAAPHDGQPQPKVQA